MARHDIYPSPSSPGFLVDLQADLLDGLTTRVVAPLMPEATALRAASLLNPVFEIEGVPHVLVTQFLAAVPAAILKAPVGSLSHRADDITRALDMVFQGF